MDLWQLQVFCKLVELKNFSKAGKAVHLSQPTVTSHIQDLEAHFGCRLIDRFARQATPTKAGQVLYEYAKRMLTMRDETETAIAEFQGNIRGRLVIGGSTIPGVYLLPKIIAGFVKEYEDVVISLLIGDTEGIADDILSGTLEVGIVGAKTDDRRIVQKKLMDDELRLVVWSDHPWAKKETIGLDMVMNEPFIVREQGSGTLRSLRDSLGGTRYGLENFRIVAEMGSTAAVVQGIRNRLGISILSEIAVADELASGVLKALTIKGLNLKRSFYLTLCKQRSLSPLARTFVAYLERLWETDGV